MKKVNEFKDTEIGRIPKEWEIVRLGDEKIIELVMGQSPPSSTYNKEKKGLPFLQGKIEFGEIYPSPEIYCSSPIKIAEPNDILLSVRAPVGDVNIAPFKCCIGRGLSAIRANPDKVHHLFLFYYLKFNGKKFEILSTGSTFKAIRRQEIESFKIPLPPLPEQRKIAEILSTVDEAIQKVDEAIQRTERLKRGLMQKLLTKGIGHKEFKDTEIGRIPKEWTVVRLKDVISLFQNGIWGEDPIVGAESYPVIRSTEITHDGKIELANVAFRKISNDKIDKYRLRDGDILLVGSSGSSHLIGRAALFQQPDDKIYFFSNFMVRIRPASVEPKFLYYFLGSPKYTQFLKSLQQTSTGLRNLPKKEFLRLTIPLPPLPEQRRIAEILSTVDKKLELERKRKEKLDRIKHGLMNDLLTGKVRVRV